MGASESSLQLDGELPASGLICDLVGRVVIHLTGGEQGFVKIIHSEQLLSASQDARSDTEMIEEWLSVA